MLLTLLYPLIGRAVNHVDDKYGCKGLALSALLLYSAYFLPLLLASGSLGYRQRHLTKAWIVFREPRPLLPCTRACSEPAASMC